MGQCAAKTKDGDPCKIETRDGEKYCYVHKKQRRKKIIAVISSVIVVIMGALGFLADVTGLLDFFGVNINASPTIAASDLPTYVPTAEIQPTPSQTPSPPDIEFNGVDVIETQLQGFICGYGKRHSIARESDGILHIFYRPFDAENNLLEAVSFNNGSGWNIVYGIGIDAPTGLGGIQCSSVVDESDTLRVVFGLSASDAFYMSKEKGTEWTEPVVRGQGDPAAGVFASEIAIGPNNSVHLVWSSKRLWYSFFDDGKWLHEVVAAPAGWHPDIDVDSAGIRHVVFNDAGFLPTPVAGENSYSPVEVRYIFSDDGKEWSNPVVINTSDDLWTGDAAIKVDANGRRHVVYIRDAKVEGYLYYTYSDDGEAWSLPHKINEGDHVPTGITGNESAALILDKWGDVFVIWQGVEDNGKAHLYLRWLDRSKNMWSKQIEIREMSGGVGLGSTPSVPFSIKSAYQDEFVIDVVWSEKTGIFYARINFDIH